MLKDILTQKGLSHREAEVAELVSKGLSNKEVAGQLFVTEKTVKFHLTNIYKKMAVKSRAQLIVWCVPHVDFVNNGQQASAPIAQPAATPTAPTAGITYSASGIIPGNNSGNNGSN
jgi:DNA-binding CsgD family transcriptional regulator